MTSDVNTGGVQGADSTAWLKLAPNPALAQHARERAASAQNRIADRITAFAGSMRFVYLHIIWFAAWIGFQVEGYPYGLLTMIVSLEAIFLSTFVMISQNRADAKHQVVADEQWHTVQHEDKQNRELLELSHQILELTRAVHDSAIAPSDGDATVRRRGFRSRSAAAPMPQSPGRPDHRDDR
jgi:uncharacterized membrane protein